MSNRLREKRVLFALPRWRAGQIWFALLARGANVGRAASRLDLDVPALVLRLVFWPHIAPRLTFGTWVRPPEFFGNGAV